MKDANFWTDLFALYTSNLALFVFVYLGDHIITKQKMGQK